VLEAKRPGPGDGEGKRTVCTDLNLTPYGSRAGRTSRCGISAVAAGLVGPRSYVLRGDDGKTSPEAPTHGHQRFLDQATCLALAPGSGPSHLRRRRLASAGERLANHALGDTARLG
jgi:hypothetical protein